MVRPAQNHAQRIWQKTTAVMTNVPGPQKAQVLGSTLEQSMFWAAASQAISVLGVSILVMAVVCSLG